MMSYLLPALHFFGATVNCADKPRLFGLVPWYEYLTLKPDAVGVCRVTNFDPVRVVDAAGHVTYTQVNALGIHSPFLLIALAILDDLIRVAALIAVGFIVYAGFQYMTSQGAPDVTKKAQQTIINALVGVAIAIIASSGVAYFGNKLGGSTTPFTLFGLPNPDTNSTIKTVMSLVFTLGASISVLMIVIGGFRYILAHGDSNAVSQARKTILYSIVGLIVTMVAYSIVTFVVRGIS